MAPGVDGDVAAEREEAPGALRRRARCVAEPKLAAMALAGASHALETGQLLFEEALQQQDDRDLALREARGREAPPKRRGAKGGGLKGRAARGVRGGGGVTERQRREEDADAYAAAMKGPLPAPLLLDAAALLPRFSAALNRPVVMQVVCPAV